MSPWAVNVLLILEATSSTLHFAVNYRVLNANIETTNYPTHRIQYDLEALDCLQHIGKFLNLQAPHCICNCS